MRRSLTGGAETQLRTTKKTDVSQRIEPEVCDAVRCGASAVQLVVSWMELKD